MGKFKTTQQKQAQKLVVSPLSDTSSDWLLYSSEFHSKYWDGLFKPGEEGMTPPAIVIQMVEAELSMYYSCASEPPRVLDPGSGSSSFLLCCFFKLREKHHDVEPFKIFKNYIYGWDNDKKKINLQQKEWIKLLSECCPEMMPEDIETVVKKNIIVNESLERYNGYMNEEYNIIFGNPPYAATAGYPTPEYFKDVDGKHGKKQLYYFFTKLGIEQLSPGGILSYVQPTCWLTSDDGIKLRKWLRDQNIEIETRPLPEGIKFDDVSTTASIQVFKKKLTNSPSQFHGPNAIYTTTEWQRRWLDAAAAGQLLKAERGKYKEDPALPLTTVYATYNLGVITLERRVKQKATKAGKLIIFPEFFGSPPLSPDGKFKAEIVDVAPFSDCFIGIETTNNAESIMSWIQSKPFHKAMSWLKGSSHGGSLCKYFITEAAFNNSVRAHYEAEERISNSR